MSHSLKQASHQAVPAAKATVMVVAVDEVREWEVKECGVKQ